MNNEDFAVARGLGGLDSVVLALLEVPAGTWGNPAAPWMAAAISDI